jgi:RNA-binding protein YlmH
MSSIHQHFRKDEKEFVDAVLQWKQFVRDQYAPTLTDFLDPRQQFIVQSLIGGQDDVNLHFYPFESSIERRRAVICPDYFVPQEEDFKVKLYEIDYPVKFVTIQHPEVLGSLMSIGLKREKFGDIIKNDSRIQLYLAEEISEYVKMELQQIGKTKIKLKQVLKSDRIQSEEVWNEKTTTVSSLRLDVLLSSIYNISRQKAQALINGGVVKVNWKLVENTSFELQEGDVISARGYGRSKVLTVEGRTKKEKWRISVGVLK